MGAAHIEAGGQSVYGQIRIRVVMDKLHDGENRGVFAGSGKAAGFRRLAGAV